MSIEGRWVETDQENIYKWLVTANKSSSTKQSLRVQSLITSFERLMSSYTPPEAVCLFIYLFIYEMVKW